MKLKNVNSLAYVNYHSDSLCQCLTNSTKVSSNLIMGYVWKQLNACPCLSPQEGLEDIYEGAVLLGSPWTKQVVAWLFLVPQERLDEKIVLFQEKAKTQP